MPEGLPDAGTGIDTRSPGLGAVGHNDAVSGEAGGQVDEQVAGAPTPAPATAGKRAGSRRAARPERSFQPRLLGLALAVTAAVVAWGYLVYAAIDFGTQARGGESAAWFFLALASVGAVACLFVGLMLIARLGRALGLTRDPATPAPPPGGRRRAATAPRER